MVTALRSVVGLIGLLGVLWQGTSQSQAVSSQDLPAPAVSLTDAQRGMLTRYCVTCHNERLQQSNIVPIRLDTVDLIRVADSSAVFERVLRKLRKREMPPPGSPRPDEATYDAVAAHLEAELDRVATANPNPGRPTTRRLNRTEYANAIRDLLAFEIDTASLLPAETLAYGFDNIGDVLSLSPGLFERYLSAARKISRLAVGDVTITPSVDLYEQSDSVLQNRERLGEEYPFGSRGGLSIRHHFPVDGEYSIRLDLHTPLHYPQQVDIRVDRERVALVPVPVSPTGRVSTNDTREIVLGDEIRFYAKAGTRTITVTFVKGTLVFEGVAPTRIPGFGHSGAQTFRELLGAVQYVSVAGPHTVTGVGDTPSRRRIFVCRPVSAGEEERCAYQILSTLARLAFRRPVGEADVAPLLALYKDARIEGQTFDGGIQRALVRLLVDPDFLFRIEQDPSGPSTVYRLSDVDLATRLSFFLWSSIPDDELLSLAERGRLKDPTVLEQQVRRMLADDRADTLVDNFAAQWLHLRNLQQFQPDFFLFPEFDDNLRRAFSRETELFLRSQIREDRPVIDTLTADYTFVNERLARHYKLPPVYGSHFRRVTLTDPSRFGLLGHGSVLAVTSYAHRTSPVLRGNWLLENILDSPVPPPPPDVPALDDQDTETGTVLTLRAKMERHRKDPACSVCHVRMDPLGFALENFDAIGQWRTVDGGAPIDPSGELPGGIKLDGPVGLRRLMADRRDEFAATVTTRLLTYALGRGVEHFDRPAIRKIVREAAPAEHRWSSIILGIVTSTPFQMKAKES